MEELNVKEMVISPNHYTHSDIEVIEVMEAFGLNFHLGNCIKYILRHEHKGKPEEDLEKAIYYLVRYYMHISGCKHDDMNKTIDIIREEINGAKGEKKKGHKVYQKPANTKTRW